MRWSGSLPRRDFLLGLAATPLLKACADAAAPEGLDASSADAASADAAPFADASPADATAADATTADAGEVDAGIVDTWARGGTASMTAKASYPNPFEGAVGSCLVLAATTAGPCTTTEDLAREDVSEGSLGLPVRLGLRVVNAACAPVAGAVIKIWHTDIEGVYTGRTPNPSFCSNNDPVAIASTAFRGVQTTDADGIAYFDTCFPGWYGGRAIHIHFQVKSGATSYLISQVYFPEAVTTEIFAEHPEYMAFGQPDTTHATDGVVAALGGADLAPYILDVQRTADGAMLASKVLSVRA